MELVKRYGGKSNKNECTALISLFYANPEKTDFGTLGFKLLWEKEKEINISELKKKMRKKS